MIRINLLATERKTKAARQPFQIGQKITVLCSLILVLAAVGVGWWYWSLQKQAATLTQEIAAAESETARLRLVISQVQQFERQREQLQQRVALIEELRKGQSEPVHMLDEISKAVPNALWLTDIKQTGIDLTLTGRCTTLTAVSDFVANLQASGYFKQVDLKDSQAEQQGPRASAETLIRFSVTAQFAPPSAQAVQ